MEEGAKGLLDGHPAACKVIDQGMEGQVDLVRDIRTLYQAVSYKGF